MRLIYTKLIYAKLIEVNIYEITMGWGVNIYVRR